MGTAAVKTPPMARKDSAIARAIVALGGKTTAPRKIGVSYMTLHTWEQRGFVRDIALAYKISKLTGIPLEDFARDAMKS